MKRAGSGRKGWILALILILAAMRPVKIQAAELAQNITTGTLTLQTNISGKTDSRYSAYRVLTAERSEGQRVYEYKVTDNFVQAGIAVDQIVSKADGAPDSQIAAETVDATAAELEKYVKINSIVADHPSIQAGNPVTLSPGYYLILETTGTAGYKQTKPMLVAVPQQTGKDPADLLYDVKVTLKDQPITTNKKIIKNGNTEVDSAANQVGTEIIFEIEQDVPRYDNTHKNITFQVKDEMGKGLDFLEIISVTAETATLGTSQYGFKETLKADGTGTLLEFNFGGTYYDFVKNAEKVKIRYKAKLNQNAILGVDGNLNKAYAVFGNGTLSDTEGTPDSTVTYAGLLELKKQGKIKEGTMEALKGAEFKVYTDSACTTPASLITYKTNPDTGAITGERNPDLSEVAVTDQNGIARFGGLGAGTYYIRETRAPEGYMRLKDAITVVVEITPPAGAGTPQFSYRVTGNGVEGSAVTVDKTGKVIIPITNTRGVLLPTTGGMGVVPFMMIGVLLLMLAGILYTFSRNRNRRK